MLVDFLSPESFKDGFLGSNRCTFPIIVLLIDVIVASGLGTIRGRVAQNLLSVLTPRSNLRDKDEYDKFA